MIKFIKSFFSKKTPPVVEQPKVEEFVAPVTVTEPTPEVSNPIIQTTVITSEATPEKKKRKTNKPKTSK
jgi:hypothetical protein